MRRSVIDSSSCLHPLFEQAVRDSPGRIAIRDGGEAISYLTLNQRANRLGWYLRSRGVGPDSTVVVCVERSVDLVVAMLATLKAGGAFLLMDPAQPVDRLRDLLAAASPVAVLTRARLAGRFSRVAPHVFRLDTAQALLPDFGDDDPPPLATPENLACLTHTSGSAGRPKGVLGTHAGMAACIAWLHRSYPLGPGDVFAQRTSPDFADSVWEILAPLTAGASLAVVPDRVARDPGLLWRFVAEHRATRLVLVPALLRALLHDPSGVPAGSTPLTHVFSSGEALPAELTRRFARLLPGTALVNVYGMSESSADVSWHHLGPGAACEGTAVPIGHPIPGTHVRLLEPGGLTPTAPGGTGEICVGGAGLARGYLGRPGATARAFVPDPLAAVPGARLYRTGDLGRRLPDGALEYVGRLDHQVKISGARVELSEVESAIAAHPRVAAAAAAVFPDAGMGSARLVGYLVADGPPVDPEELRTFLADRLPARMVPSVFVGLPALPLTPAGKTDRRALPAPSGSRPAHLPPRTAPRTPGERLAADVWSQVLGVAPVGVHDLFVSLGGTSLSAMRVAAELRERTGEDVTATAMFEHGTVGRLAAAYGLAPVASASPAPPARSADAGPPRTAPLSSGQRRMLFLDRLEPGSPRYVVPYAFRIRGPLDADALERALGGVMARHDTLRTVVTDSAGEWSSRVADVPEAMLSRRDVRALPDERRPTAVEEDLAELVGRPFDLAREPMVRATLLRTADEEWVFGLAFHHIAVDGASLTLFTRELAAAYRAVRAGTPWEPPELAVGYAEFAARQDARGADPAALTFWRRHLTGVRQVELPGDRPRPAGPDSRGALHRVRLAPSTADALRRLAGRAGASPYMTLLAAVKVLLARWSGGFDITVGAPVSRREPPYEGVIGFFGDTLVLRTDLSGDPTGAEVLARVRRTVLDALAHRDTPFERLVEQVAPPRIAGRSPFFDVMVAQDDGPRDLVLPGVACERREVHTGAAIFDLTFHLSEPDERGLEIAVEYRTALFDEATVHRMAARLGTVALALADEPDTPLSRLPLLPQEERRMLARWNGTELPPPAVTLPGLVWAQAARTPEATACRFAGREIGYRELTDRAGRIAAALRERGARAGRVVAVCLERSLALPAALLGVMATGAAYLPLDPAHPAERLAWLLEDSRALLVLADAASAGRLPDTAAVLRVDVPLDGPPAEPVALPDDLAYVIYTSGSTGVPKGVEVEHRSVANRLLWTARLASGGPGTRVLQKTPATFDVSVWELFWPLVTGGTLVLAEPGRHGDPDYVARTIVEERVTVAHFVPSMLRAFAGAGHLPALRGLRMLCLSGEALDPDLAHALPDTLGERVPVHNLYGPTETSVEVGHWRLAPRTDGRVPIGSPVDGVGWYVLDRRMEPAPVGVPGELYVGGAALARGYLRRPGLTAERFVPHPWSPVPGARLYRTGDLVRYLADGQVDFLGRLDHQVKIRGFRVELGEVEARLTAHPLVAGAVVAAREHAPGDVRLVAYVTAAGDPPPDGELRRWLAAALPEYMLPSAFMVLDGFPLGPSGKLDRAALPEPRYGRAAPDPAAGPEGDERVMAELFAKVLGAERVGAGDDFFELGGHSLLAMKLLGQVTETFGAALPLRAVFDSPTPAGLLAALGRV